MKRLLALALVCAPVLAQVPANPSTITVDVGPGSTVTETTRPTNTTRNVHITHNPQDTVKVIEHPHMTNGWRVDLSTVAPIPPGFDTDRVKDTAEVAPLSETGSFRTVCTLAKVEESDPLVYPGMPGKSHSHTVVGNQGFDAFQNSDSLLAGGLTTCRGGTINRSIYWVPTMIDDRTNKPIFPKSFSVYYKVGINQPKDPANPGFGELVVQDLPFGYRGLSGDPGALVATSGKYRWNCRVGTTNNFVQYIPDDVVKCPAGGTLGLEIFFGGCWDGVNVDSPDHKSHRASTIRVKVPGSNPAVYVETCPTTHPVSVPGISFSIEYTITDIRNMRLVSDVDTTRQRGITAPGDFWAGHKAKYMKMWVAYCLRGSEGGQRDCHSHLIGRDPDDGKLKQIF
jgi:hypothetical protein